MKTRTTMARRTNDLLIFDVDGVLIDTRDSFMYATRECLRWCWEHLLGGIADCEGYTLEHFNVSKTHPSFNDDSVVAWVLLHHMEHTGKKRMSEAFPSLEEWKSILFSYDRQNAAETVAASREASLSLIEVRNALEEFYYGTKDYLEYKGSARYGILTDGLWKTEIPAITRNWKALPLPSAIYTGRSHEEMALGKRQLGWEDFPDDRLVTSGDGILKPSPLGLEMLCRAAGAAEPLFFGDTASDKESWLNFGRGSFVAIGPILKGEALHFDTLEEALRRLEI